MHRFTSISNVRSGITAHANFGLGSLLTYLASRKRWAEGDSLPVWPEGRYEGRGVSTKSKVGRGLRTGEGKRIEITWGGAKRKGGTWREGGSHCARPHPTHPAAPGECCHTSHASQARDQLGARPHPAQPAAPGECCPQSCHGPQHYLLFLMHYLVYSIFNICDRLMMYQGLYIYVA